MMLSKTRKPTLACLREEAPSYKDCPMETRGEDGSEVSRGRKEKWEEAPSIFSLPYILSPDWLLCWNVRQ